MTQELIERTAREWVFSNPGRGARCLDRLRSQADVQPAQSAQEVADALIELAGRMHIAQTRSW